MRELKKIIETKKLKNIATIDKADMKQLKGGAGAIIIISDLDMLRGDGD